MAIKYLDKESVQVFCFFYVIHVNLENIIWQNIEIWYDSNFYCDNINVLIYRFHFLQNNQKI